MKKTLEDLWNKYLMDECSKIDTENEKRLTAEVAILHEKTNELLDDKQKEAIENYVDLLLELDAILVKKAFIKGCEFSVSFLLESET